MYAIRSYYVNPGRDELLAGDAKALGLEQVEADCRLEQREFEPGPEPGVGEQRRQALAGLGRYLAAGRYQEEGRITSYDVCYTKLLRQPGCCFSVFHGRSLPPSSC